MKFWICLIVIAGALGFGLGLMNVRYQTAAAVVIVIVFGAMAGWGIYTDVLEAMTGGTGESKEK